MFQMRINKETVVETRKTITETANHDRHERNSHTQNKPFTSKYIAIPPKVKRMYLLHVLQYWLHGLTDNKAKWYAM